MYQRQLSFGEAVTRALTENYCNFSGRSSRSEYWWYVLFGIIVNVVLSIVQVVLGDTAGMIISGLISLALLLPSLGLCVRRLHDTGRSGWWVLLALIPLVGGIILIVWFCGESQPNDNEYGPVPNLTA